MAFIDISLLQSGSYIFVFLLVWALVFAILSFTKLFDTKNEVKALLSVVVALLTMLSPKISSVVSYVVPWFSLLFIMTAFILVGVMIFGVSHKDITSYIKDSPGGTTITYWIIILSAIIVVAGIGSVFFSGENPDPDTQTVISSNGTVTSGDVGSVGSGALLSTLFHPRMLGLLFVMLMALFAVLQLAK